jgi:xylulokinase
MTLSYVIGCDIGTQSSKGVLVDDSGATVATATSGYGMESPAPGWAQQDPADWLRAVEQVVGTLTGAADGPVSVVGVSAQVDGVVATDGDLNPLHPAIIWLDRRAADEAAAAEEAIGGDALYNLTGLNCDATHSAAKMRWLVDHLDTTPRHLIPPSTMVTGWLTGELAQDHANASSSMLYDIRERDWAESLLGVFGIDPATLPRIVDSTDVVGTIRPDIAGLLGLDPDCRVVAGTGDDHAGAVGAGAVEPGVVVDVTGTAEPIGTTAYSPALDPARLIEAHAHAVPDVWFIENGGFVSGGSILWMSRVLGIDQPEVFARAGRARPGSKGLVFVPALSGSMTPRWNAHARGSFTGLAIEHGSEELCRAVVESCVFAARDIVDRLAEMSLPIDEIRVIGGGSRSELWMQMKADVLRRPVRAVLGEACALGAASLAAVAAGWHSDLPGAAKAMAGEVGPAFEPDPSLTGVYEDSYRRYRQAFDALEPTYEAS